jgi:hypothetical protein
MFYADGTDVQINDIVVVPSREAFAGRICGIFPPEGEVEVWNDDPRASFENKRVSFPVSEVFPAWV